MLDKIFRKRLRRPPGIILVAAFAIIFTATTQSSAFEKAAEPGLPEDAGTHFLQNYRLPAWQIHQLEGIVNFSSGQGNTHDTGRETNSYDGNVNLYYWFRYESDDYQHSGRADYSFRTNGFNDQQPGVPETGSDSVTHDIYAEYNGFVYIWRDLFINTRPAADYSDTVNSTISDGQTDESTTRTHYHHVSLGLGYGRIRNVTPVMRSLRLKKRYDSLGYGKPFTDEDVQKAAEVFANFGNAGLAYDRPEKYFWQAMDRGLDDKLSRIKVEDAFYLGEALTDRIAFRQQGFRVDFGGGTETSLYGTEDEWSEPDYRLYYYLRGEFAHNFTLSQQLTAFSEFRRYVTEEPEAIESEDWSIGLDYLFEITDRLNVTAGPTIRFTFGDSPVSSASPVGATTIYGVPNDIGAYGNSVGTSTLFWFYTNCNWYIEDKLLLTAGYNVETSRQDTSLDLFAEDYNHRFTLSLNYNLFRFGGTY